MRKNQKQKISKKVRNELAVCVSLITALFILFAVPDDSAVVVWLRVAVFGGLFALFLYVSGHGDHQGNH